LKAKKYLNLNDYELFVFDCDGVLLDSNSLKSQAFRLTLDKYPKELVDDFISYHEINGGISRHVKFEYFLSNILKITNYQKEYKSLLKKFSKVSMNLIISEAKFIPGIKDLLKIIHKKNKHAIVCSGTDEIDLQNILALKEIDHYFSYIYGSPKTKKDILFKTLSTFQSNSIKGIFFGDALSDYEAAIKFGFDFIFVSYNSDWSNISQIPNYKNLSFVRSFEDLQVIES